MLFNVFCDVSLVGLISESDNRRSSVVKYNLLNLMHSWLCVCDTDDCDCEEKVRPETCCRFFCSSISFVMLDPGLPFMSGFIALNYPIHPYTFKTI